MAHVLPRGESNPASKPSPKTPDRRRKVGFTIGYIATTLIGLWLLQVLLNPMIQAAARDIPYSEFRTKVKAGQVVDVSLGSPRITGHLKNAAATSERDRIVSFRTVAPLADAKLLDDLEAAGQVRCNPADQFRRTLFPVIRVADAAARLVLVHRAVALMRHGVVRLASSKALSLRFGGFARG